MKKLKESIQLVPIAEASDETSAIRIKMLLNRAMVPYVVQNERINTIYGYAGALFGPVKFLVRADQQEQAEEALYDLFELDVVNLPPQCPACDSDTLPGRFDCPSCGLFLG